VATEMSRKRPQTSLANGASAISLSFKIEQQIGRMLSATELRPAVLFAVIWLGWLISWIVAALWSNRIEKRLFKLVLPERRAADGLPAPFPRDPIGVGIKVRQC
jgi:hypothetical protein